MERVGDAIRRVLKEKKTFKEEKDYLALWDEVVPPGIRKHARASVRGGNLYVRADNPTTSHLLFLHKERIINDFKENNLTIKGIVVKQGGGRRLGG